uniref:Uncharacterized protein n=1 Tax=Dulem virus 42 TaxID=3145760 RepID=A0AAU8B7S7_9CAUD
MCRQSECTVGWWDNSHHPHFLSYLPLFLSNTILIYSLLFN